MFKTLRSLFPPALLVAAIFLFITYGHFAKAFASGLANSTWPKHGATQENSSYVSQNLVPYLTLNWIYTLGMTGGENTAPIVDSDGTIYIPTNTQLRAINPDGTLKWTYTYGGSSSSTNRSTPTLDSSDVLWIEGYNGTTGLLYAINSADGSLKCSFNSSGTSTDLRTRSIAISPDGSVAYYPRFSSRNLFAVNTSDCSQKWVVSFASSGTTEHENMAPSVDSTGIIYLGHALGVTAFNPSDGSVKWAYTTKTRIKSGPTLSPDETKLYVVTSSPSGFLVALNTTNGAEAWDYQLQNVTNYYYAQPGVDTNGNIYVGLGGFQAGINSFRSFNSDGTLRWSTEDNVFTRNGLIIGNNYVYGIRSTSGANGYIHSFDKSTGTRKQQYLPTASFGSVDGGVQPAIDSDGNVYYSGRTKLVKLVSWTLDTTTDASYYTPGDTIQFTVTSSMLQADPSASENNQVQIILPSSDKVTLSYSDSSGGNTVWTGSWTIPTDTVSGSYNATVEAAVYNSSTDVTTHFDSAPTGSSNTGITDTVTYVVDEDKPKVKNSGNTGEKAFVINPASKSNSGKTAKYTNNKKVKIYLNTGDATSSVDEMKICNNKEFKDCSWEDYRSKFNFRLSGKDGKKTVYLKLKDEVGNVSKTYTQKITLDTSKPSLILSSISGDLFLPSYTKFWTEFNTPEFKGTSEEGISISLFVDDVHIPPIIKVPENGDWVISHYKFIPGTHKVVFEAKDPAGNSTQHPFSLLILP